MKFNSRPETSEKNDPDNFYLVVMMLSVLLPVVVLIMAKTCTAQKLLHTVEYQKTHAE